jgi:hypothetical protein
MVRNFPIWEKSARPEFSALSSSSWQGTLKSALFLRRIGSARAKTSAAERMVAEM